MTTQLHILQNDHFLQNFISGIDKVKQVYKTKYPPFYRWIFLYVRQRPTLPPGLPRSTIGAERLSFQVRNGAGRFPLAMITVTLLSFVSGLTNT